MACHRFCYRYLLALSGVAAAGLLASCTAMPEGAQPQQTAASTECKIVLVDSASQEIHGYATLGREKYQENTPTEKDLAIAGVGKAQVFNQGFRSGVNEPNTVAQARRGC